jgi:hypothetical protein
MYLTPNFTIPQVVGSLLKVADDLGRTKDINVVWPAAVLVMNRFDGFHNRPGPDMRLGVQIYERLL